jgi:hypothetical protein
LHTGIISPQNKRGTSFLKRPYKIFHFPQKRLAEQQSKRSFRDFTSPPVRLARSRTHGFHPCDRGSNPLREAIFKALQFNKPKGFFVPALQQNAQGSPQSACTSQVSSESTHLNPF